MDDSANIARHLAEMATRQPHTPALKIPRGRENGRIDYLSLTYSELHDEVDSWMHEFQRHGVAAGDRVLVMVRQGLPLIAGAFALFSYGAVPVVIDPGMGLRSFLSCVRRTQPKVLLGIPLARLISRVFRSSFPSVQIRVPASGNPLARHHHRRARRTAKMAVLPRAGTDLAAILFTSGSTGAPKGVCYEHGMFAAQVRLIQATYDIQPGEVDLPMLPIFALFNPALGMTTVVPEIDPGKPAAVDPAKIVEAIQQEKVTNSFGSPTLWNKIADYCIQNQITLPSLKRVLSAGAPVPLPLWEKSRQFLTGGQLHSPYGATESLPVSSISAIEVTALSRAAATSLTGTCVGKPAPEIEVRVIALTDQPIASLDQTQALRTGEIGELIVTGPVVTKNYDGLPEATRSAKIQGDTVWHRMGDCAYLDAEGRIWFCGRKVERVETETGPLFTEPFERIFRDEDDLARCALIGLGTPPRQTPALVVQPKRHLTAAERTGLARRLHARSVACHAITPAARIITHFFFHPHFPVDVRHNAKIHRLTLARWAATHTPLVIS